MNKPPSLLTFVMAIVLALTVGCCLKRCDGAASARIVTRPPQGPFRLGQTVQFICEVDSLPTENLTFQWRSVEHTYGNGFKYSGPSINITFTDSHTLRYVWFFCSIWRNTTQLTSSDKIVEIHGLLNTDDLVTRSFSLHQIILLQINTLSESYYGYLADYVSSLTWYHNGTEILSNERMDASNNGTSLIISDMIDSDAGTYEVKISSINYNNSTSSATCDRNVLRLLEQTALHAPVTFYLQQYHIPQYKPEDIIELYFLPINPQDISSYTITINYTIDIDTRVLLGVPPRYWDQWFFRNGVSQSPNTDNVITERSFGNEINISHQLRYNDTDEIIGHYVYMESKVTFFNSMFRHSCRGYHDYIEDNFSFIISVLVHYWSLKIKSDGLEAQALHPRRLPQCSEVNQARSAIIRDVVQHLINHFGVQPLGKLPEFPAASCSEVEQAHLQPLPGLYWISQNGMTPTQIFCDF